MATRRMPSQSKIVLPTFLGDAALPRLPVATMTLFFACFFGVVAEHVCTSVLLRIHLCTQRVSRFFSGPSPISQPHSSLTASKLQSYSSLDNPVKLSTLITGFFEKYPLATKHLMTHGDKSYFLNIAQRSDQNPAPFIPILDNNFEVWFKEVRPSCL